MKENWKPIFDGVYAVSDQGRVARLLTRLGHTKPAHILVGVGRPYLMLTLCWRGARKRRTIHSLVAEAFFGARLPTQQVNHLDGDKTNNRLSNLEYTTASKNMLHAISKGLVAVGARHYKAKLTDADVRAIRRRYQRGNGVKLAAEFGVHVSMVHYIVRRKNWKHM